MVRMILVTALVLLTGCGSETPPEEVCKRYLEALSSGDLDAAFDCLDQETRQVLLEAEEAWRAGKRHPLAPPGEAPAEGKDGRALFRVRMAGADGTSLPPLPEDPAKLVERVQVDGDRARVTVRTPLGSRVVQLVHEEDGWAVKLELGLR